MFSAFELVSPAIPGGWTIEGAKAGDGTDGDSVVYKHLSHQTAPKVIAGDAS